MSSSNPPAVASGLAVRPQPREGPFLGHSCPLLGNRRVRDKLRAFPSLMNQSFQKVHWT